MPLLTLLLQLRYFVDKEVLDRVPPLFLLLAGISAAVQVVALAVLRDPTAEELNEILVMISLSDESNHYYC